MSNLKLGMTKIQNNLTNLEIKSTPPIAISRMTRRRRSTCSRPRCTNFTSWKRKYLRNLKVKLELGRIWNRGSNRSFLNALDSWYRISEKKV
jgi:hypothetical protein